MEYNGLKSFIEWIKRKVESVFPPIPLVWLIGFFFLFLHLDWNAIGVLSGDKVDYQFVIQHTFQFICIQIFILLIKSFFYDVKYNSPDWELGKPHYSSYDYLLRRLD